MPRDARVSETLAERGRWETLIYRRPATALGVRAAEA